MDLWWSGKHANHGGNLQVVATPDDWPLWTSDVRPGHERGEHLPRPRKLTAWSSIRAGLMFGLGLGLVFGLVVRPVFGLLVGLAVALLFWFAFGLAEWAKTPSTNERPQTPTVTFRRDLQLVYFYSLTFGLIFGLGFGLVFGLVVGFDLGPGLGAVFGTGLGPGLAVGLGIGLGVLLIAGFVFGLGQSSGQHLITVAILRSQGHVPLRLLTFLDDARRLGIPREAGPVYRFRHAKLQDRLARTPHRFEKRPPRAGAGSGR